MARQPRDIGATVRARLLNLAREKGQAFDLLLTRYAAERLLYRLSTTLHRDRFVLKGAMLMTAWFDAPHRPTRDVDFLGYGDSTPESMLAVFREICAIEGGDGVIFDVDTLQVELIPEEVPDALTAAFAADATKQRQWAAFVRDLAADAPALETIVTDLADFLMPYAQQARHRSRGWLNPIHRRN